MNLIGLLGDAFNVIFFAPIINVLVFILRILEASHIPGALGFAIILMTILIRLLIWPLMHTQLKSMRKMSELKPKLDDLKEEHKDNKQALAAAQMALYKEHGVNPAGGCLPTLIQIPPLIAIYRVIFSFFQGNQGLSSINNFLYFPSWKLTSSPDLHFFGLNLADKPSDFARVGILILLIPVLTALLQFLQSKMMTPAPVKEYPSDSPKEKKEKESTEETMAAVQSQMSFMMPLVIGYVSFTFPIGLAIYWNTLTIFGIWQQYLISGWGGMADLMQNAKGKIQNYK